MALLLDREAGRLSGGETQRVAVARAVAAGADVMLLDEPTSSMDAGQRIAVRALLLELKQRRLDARLQHPRREPGPTRPRRQDGPLRVGPRQSIDECHGGQQ